MKSKTINHRRLKQRNASKALLSTTPRIVNIKQKDGTFKTVLFNSLLKTKKTPKTHFEVTEIGLTKRESGKYKSRWRKH